MIVGHNTLRAFGVQLDFEEGQHVCNGVSIPMRKFPNNTSEITPIKHLLQDYLDCTRENDKDGISFEDNFAAETLESLYEAGDVRAISDSCAHLTAEQQKCLFKLLCKLKVLFNNMFKMITDEKTHLKINPSVTPNHSCAYAVPHSHKATFKKDLN